MTERRQEAETRPVALRTPRRPADKRRRFPDPTERPEREATPQETTTDGHDG